MAPLLAFRMLKSYPGFQVWTCLSLKRSRWSTGGFEPRIVLLLDKHHNHLNQKSALSFGSSDYGAYIIPLLSTLAWHHLARGSGSILPPPRRCFLFVLLTLGFKNRDDFSHACLVSWNLILLEFLLIIFSLCWLVWTYRVSLPFAVGVDCA